MLKLRTFASGQIVSKQSKFLIRKDKHGVAASNALSKSASFRGLIV